MAGTWVQARDLLAKGQPKTAREIAAHIDGEPTEVRKVLCIMAKRGKVVRVLRESGALQWRLVDDGGAQ